MDNRTLEIKKKKYGLELIRMGFELLDIKSCGEEVYCIFKYTDEAEKAFKQLMEENKKRKYLLSKTDICVLTDALNGYEILEEDRIRLLGILTKHGQVNLS